MLRHHNVERIIGVLNFETSIQTPPAPPDFVLVRSEVDIMATTVARLLCVATFAATSTAQFTADVLVYGSTPGAIMAAVAAARTNATVIVLDPAQQVGGMCSGGLGATDKGDTFAIGGLAHEFFLRVARTYNASTNTPQYMLEPHVAQNVFIDMLNLPNNIMRVVVPNGLQSVAFTSFSSGADSGAAATGRTIASVTTPEGIAYAATVFIDGTYEGDLLALANATMAIGREPNTTYHESYAGRRQPYSTMDYAAVSPYDNVTGALLPLNTDAYAQPLGSGDSNVQAYNFRLCVTKESSNMIKFTQPANYNASYWQLLRNYAAVAAPTLSSFLNNIQALPNGKYDMNNGGIISTDCAGCSWAWPSANVTDRVGIWQAHYDYQMGFLWTLGHDEAIPAAVRDEINSYGLCADEFPAVSGNGYPNPYPGWPSQLYVREARRLVGDDIFNQSSVQSQTDFKNASIGLGSYAFDGHYSHRGPCIPTPDGKGCDMWTEPTPPPPGTKVWLGGEGYPGPQTGLYQIPYSVLLPKRSELLNILAPTTPSASHVAFCTVRMEPQFMILGHAAGDAAVLAARAGVAVQDVDVAALHAQLKAEGAVLCHTDYPNC